MNAKTLVALVAVAAILIALAFVGELGERRGATTTGDIGAALLPDLEAELNSIDHVAVVGAGRKPVATLTRTADGWTIAELDGYPADVVKIRKALVALADARILEDKTSNPDYYSRLGVDAVDADDARGLEISISTADHDFPAIIVGDLSGKSDRFVRRADEERSYLIDHDPDLSTNAAQWADSEIIDVASARIQRVEITHADGERLVISKSGRDQTSFDVENVPEGRELQYATIANVTGGALRQLRLESAARLSEAPPSPATTSEFRTFDGLVVTVTGFPVEDETWVSFAARYDADQAQRFAPESAEGGAGESEGAAGDDNAPAGEATAEAADENADQAADDSGAGGATSEATAGNSVQQEAATIEARVGGWRYRIPEHQYDQMTRRMEDLLKPAE